MGNIVSKTLIAVTLIVIFQAYNTISGDPQLLLFHAGLNKNDTMLTDNVWRDIRNYVGDNRLARHFIETYLNQTLPRKPLCNSTIMKKNIKCGATSDTVVKIEVECIQSLLNFGVFLLFVCMYWVF